MNRKILAIGTDPEFFVSKNGRIVTSQSAGIHGTKDNPYLVGRDLFVQRDNVALEISLAPSTTAKQFSKSLIDSMRLIENKYGINLMCVPSHVFNEQEINHPEAYEFGCEPDLNAYTIDFNDCPYAENGLRSAGGHVHVSYEPDLDEDFNVTLAKSMDLFLSLPMVLKDKDTQRRKLYGKAGAFRNKPYGMEYRTLSNKWLDNEEMMEWVFENTKKAMDFANKIHDSDEANSINFEMIEEAINSSDEDIATAICRHHDVPLLEAV